MSNKSLIQQCVDVLKQEDIRKEFKLISKPVFDLILHDINPYIYMTGILVILTFIVVLSILILLIHMQSNMRIA